MACVLLLEELLPKNSFLFSIQQETFFYFYFFNLIFPANMDLQGLPLTAWGWEEASPQAKSFWPVSFIGILPPKRSAATVRDIISDPTDHLI